MGLALLLTLCAVMATVSYLAGLVPMSVRVSPRQLRAMQSVGVGLLMGTALIVVLPEGIHTVIASGSSSSHSHSARSLSSPQPIAVPRTTAITTTAWSLFAKREKYEDMPDIPPLDKYFRLDHSAVTEDSDPDQGSDHDQGHDHPFPGAAIGLALMTGFTLMFLLDRLPAYYLHMHPPPPRDISLDSLTREPLRLHTAPLLPTQTSTPSSQLSSAPPRSSGLRLLWTTVCEIVSPSSVRRNTRSLATTVGLLLHAAADGIAMGASSTTSNARLGFLVFVAILLHKAPMSFGLASLLMKQGLPKHMVKAHLVLFSLAAPAGAVGAWIIICLLSPQEAAASSSSSAAAAAADDTKGWWTGMVLLFSAGSFLYVAMHALQDFSSTDHDSSDNGNHDASSPASPNSSSLPKESSLPSSSQHAGSSSFADPSDDDFFAHSHHQARPTGESHHHHHHAKVDLRDTLLTIFGLFLPLLLQMGGHAH